MSCFNISKVSQLVYGTYTYINGLGIDNVQLCPAVEFDGVYVQ